MKKVNCYDEWWLRKDMENMGYIFEYCDKYCKDLFNVKIDKKKFLNAFMVSRFRYTMETGHERMLSQAGRDSVKMFVNVDCDEMLLNLQLKRVFSRITVTDSFTG